MSAIDPSHSCDRIRKWWLHAEDVCSRLIQCRIWCCRHTIHATGNMKPKQYAEELLAGSCKVDDVYEDGRPNDAFTKNVDSSILHSFRNCSAQNSRADLIDIAFHAESLLFFQKGAGIKSTANHRNLTTNKSPTHATMVLLLIGKHHELSWNHDSQS